MSEIPVSKIGVRKITSLPDAKPVEPPHEVTPEQVQKDIDYVHENVLVDMIQKYTKMRDTRLMIEGRMREMKVTEEELEEEIWNTMEAWGFTSIKTENDGTIVRTFNRIFNITDLRSFRQWAIDTDQFDLLREEPHKSNLREYCNAKVKNGEAEAIPPGVELIIDKIIQIRGRRRDDS